MTRIAILGVGNTGTCTALELAGRGLDVDLYDECDEPIRRASFHNEGKVHLGILYAKDRTLRTAELMIRGALSFAALIDRWVGFDRSRLEVSTPFFYAVHVGTMMDVDGLRAHYASCQRLFDELHRSCGASYLGRDRALEIEELSRTEMESLVAGEHFVTLFRTSERAVDPRTVAGLLRAAALAHPRIHCVLGARVMEVAPLDRGGLAVSFRKDGQDYLERYDQVANSLWHGRLRIDAQVGLAQDHPWLHRYKLANRVLVPLTNGDIPSITCVLGPFGDIVNYGRNGLF
ncbi:MAG: FAD-dependent oxidoreductase, partial [Thermoanaerobaculia bacterium]